MLTSKACKKKITWNSNYMLEAYNIKLARMFWSNNYNPQSNQKQSAKHGLRASENITIDITKCSFAGGDCDIATCMIQMPHIWKF